MTSFSINLFDDIIVCIFIIGLFCILGHKIEKAFDVANHIHGWKYKNIIS